jgi:5-methylcytosine-specific restriction protein A
MDALPPLDEAAQTGFLKTKVDRRTAAYEAAKDSNRKEWFRQYNAYLESEEWKLKRNAVLQRDHHLCQGCLKATAQQVHHLTYDNVGGELLFQLVSLCAPCHALVHTEG